MKGFLAVFALISAVSCSEFIVLKSPKSIEFKGTSDLPAECLSDVLTSALGYSIQGSTKWDGVYVNDPFNTAKGVFSIVIEGGEDLKFKDSKTFNIVGEENRFEDALLSRVMEHSHLAIDVDLVEKDEVMTPFGELKKSSIETDVKFLKAKKHKSDKDFLKQIAYLQSLTQLFSDGKELPTAVNVRVSLKMIEAEHSDSSAAIAEAEKLLIATIEKLNAAVEKVYNGDAVFAVITVDEHQHMRSKRQTEEDYNLAEATARNYPVIFNIIFWFSVVLIFSLIAISLALSNVEDKDSIIYRMTGARGKKEN